MSKILAVLVMANSVIGQSAAGASAKGSAGYGKTFEAAGSSAAAGRVRQGISQALRRAAERKRILAAKASAAAKPPMRSARPRNSAVPTPPPPPPVAASTFFKPNPAIDTIGTLADDLGTTAEEKSLLRELFGTTKAAFEAEVAAKGRKNNVASAFVLFIAATATVYHDAPEPSDEAVETLWDGLNAVFAEMPEFTEMPDRDKQEIYDTLIALSGLVLTGYLHAKENADADSMLVYRELAGTLIQSVLKTDPEKLRFGADGLVLN